MWPIDQLYIELGVDPCLHYFSTDVTLRAGYIAAEVKHDFLFDTQMSLGRETSAEKSGL